MKCNSWRGKLIIFISVAANIFFLVNIRLFTWTPDPYLLQNGGKLEKGKLEKDKIELNEHLDLETTKENSIMNFEEPAPLEAPQRKNLRPSPPRGDQQEGKDEMSPKGGQEEQRARPPRLEPQIPGPIGEKAEEERRRRVREKSDRRAERKPREPDAFQGPLAHEKKRNVAASARQPEGRRAVRREREGIPPDVEERLRQKEELLKAREFNGRVHDWGEEQDVEDAEGLPPPMKGFGKHRGEEGEEGHRHKHPKEPPHGRGAMDREDFHGQKKPHRRQWREDINEREIQDKNNDLHKAAKNVPGLHESEGGKRKPKKGGEVFDNIEPRMNTKKKPEDNHEEQLRQREERAKNKNEVKQNDRGKDIEKKSNAEQQQRNAKGDNELNKPDQGRMNTKKKLEDAVARREAKEEDLHRNPGKESKRNHRTNDELGKGVPKGEKQNEMKQNDKYFNEDKSKMKKGSSDTNK